MNIYKINKNNKTLKKKFIKGVLNFINGKNEKIFFKLNNKILKIQILKINNIFFYICEINKNFKNEIINISFKEINNFSPYKKWIKLTLKKKNYYLLKNFYLFYSFLNNRINKIKINNKKFSDINLPDKVFFLYKDKERNYILYKRFKY
ncbi:hypothetical protein ACT2CR_00120 [Candidatus Vidania fulgoroideorum]